MQVISSNIYADDWIGALSVLRDHCMAKQCHDNNFKFWFTHPNLVMVM